MSVDTDEFALILPAAGEGIRLGHDLPKALVPIGGIPLIRRTVERFASFTALAEVVVAAPASYVEAVESSLRGALPSAVVVQVVPGGATRQESVAIARAALRASTPLVCVHDAARPLVSPATIAAVVAAATASGAATAASRPSDSVRQDLPSGETRALDRSTLWLVETPQVFAAELLDEAHRLARARRIEATDDASLVEALTSARVSVVASDGPNLKVTTRADLELVARLCR